nr:hypothetical protein GCM10017745_50100 [Saccharothrix mutabilis subsp. capreolus]
MEHRKALVLGIGEFTGRVAAGEEPALDSTSWPPLSFVETVVPRLDAAFRKLDYEVHSLRDPQRPALVDAVTRDLGEAGTCLVVHTVSHGKTGDDDTRLDVVPACGTTSLGTNVSEWISAAQERRAPTLFLLDLCRAGRAARLPWLTARAGHDSRAWVIAGAGPDEDAFDGRFSDAVASVLEQLTHDGLGTDPSVEYVSFQTLARRIAERVEAAPGIPQRVHATPIDPSRKVPDLPFFRNPNYVDDQQLKARQAIEPPLRSFLDELDDVMDAEHFLGRVGSHFAGRRRQLRRLARWMDGEVPTSGLRVVTGSPGTGSRPCSAPSCAPRTLSWPPSSPRSAPGCTPPAAPRATTSSEPSTPANGASKSWSPRSPGNSACPNPPATPPRPRWPGTLPACPKPRSSSSTRSTRRWTPNGWSTTCCCR